MDLVNQGVSIRETARRLGLGRDTVRRYVRAGEFPEMAQRQQKTPGKLGPYTAYLKKRWAEGCHNRLQLWREISEQGFDGTHQLVYHWARKQGLRKEPKSKKGETRKAPAPAIQPWAASRAVWLLMKAETDLNQEEQQALQRMKQAEPKLEQAIELGTQFRTMARDRQSQAFPDWLKRVDESGIVPLVRFAEGLKGDRAAVEAALSLPWSNGVVEGHVNRLKMIKRQMFGRANFDLLRKCVLLM